MLTVSVIGFPDVSVSVMTVWPATGGLVVVVVPLLLEDPVDVPDCEEETEPERLVVVGVWLVVVCVEIGLNTDSPDYGLLEVLTLPETVDDAEAGPPASLGASGLSGC